MKSLTKLRQKLRERGRKKKLGREYAKDALRDRARVARISIFVVAALLFLQGTLTYFIENSAVQNGLAYLAELKDSLFVDQEKRAAAEQELIARGEAAWMTAMPAVILGVVFCALGFASRDYPFGASLFALVLFVSLIGLTLALNPAALLSVWGVMLNLMILIGLSGAVFRTRSLRKFAAGSASSKAAQPA